MHEPNDPVGPSAPDSQVSPPQAQPPPPQEWTRPQADVRLEAGNAGAPAGAGSMLKGYLLGWVVPIAASMASGLVLGLVNAVIPSSGLTPMLGVLGLLAPFVAFGFLVAWAYRDGPRTGRGVWAAALTLVGVIVLLVAACFGMLARGMFGNMH